MDNTVNTSDHEFVNETYDSKSEEYRLRQENEKYRQEVYEMRRALDISVAVQKDLEEINQSLEQSLATHSSKHNQKIQEWEERYRAMKEEYEDRLNNADIDIQNKTKEITALRDRVTEIENYISKTEKTQDQSSCSEDIVIAYKQEIEKYLIALQDAEKKNNELDAMNKDLSIQCLELKEIVEASKHQMAEKNKQLESISEVLAMCRTELNTLKATPANDSTKGNSLFAEVEDRYQMIVGKMNMLQSKYQEAKRLCQLREAENKALKAERAAMVQKWEHDMAENMGESNELVQKYKSKIEDLEYKLKMERKKDCQETKINDSFGYLQTLLAAKKKEVVELQSKIENDAIKSLVQEDLKFQLSEQLRYWRYKAMSMQAQILSLKGQIEFGLDSNAQKMINEVVENCTINETNIIEKSKLDYSIVADEWKNNLEQLTEIPKPPTLCLQEPPKSTLDESDISGFYDQLSTLNIDNYIEQQAGKLKSIEPTLVKKTNSRAMDFEDKENYQVVNMSLEAEPQMELDTHDAITTKKVKKILRFTEDTKDTKNTNLRRQKKEENYPFVLISKK